MSGVDQSQVPRFAVVGHPNKGKSSIVATLARDDSVAIGSEPGTTISCRTYPMKVDGVLLYTLIDTPGFQRARRALAAMKQQESSSADRPKIVRQFVEDPANKKAFPDECELLTPIVEGAGVLYVVDGSVPYSEQYESELEILRWSGQPRMALINTIGEANFLDQWTNALGQYFNVVRVFDAMTAEFEKQIDLLRTFGQLQEEWREPIARATKVLSAERADRSQRVARLIAEMLIEMITLQVEVKSSDIVSDEGQEQMLLEARYRDSLSSIEQRVRTSVEYLFQHDGIQKTDYELIELQSDELFSERTWRLFGLSRREILTMSAVAGAAMGGAVDIATGGASLFLGAIVGGAVGASTAFFAAETLIDVRVLTLPLGKRLLVAGPVRSINFPYVVLGRARLHHKLVSERTHARRDTLDLRRPLHEVLQPLSGEEKVELEKIFLRARRGTNTSADSDLLTAKLKSVLQKDVS